MGGLRKGGKCWASAQKKEGGGREEKLPSPANYHELLDRWESGKRQAGAHTGLALALWELGSILVI